MSSTSPPPTTTAAVKQDGFGVLDACHRQTLVMLDKLATLVASLDDSPPDPTARATARELVSSSRRPRASTTRTRNGTSFRGCRTATIRRSCRPCSGCSRIIIGWTSTGVSSGRSSPASPAIRTITTSRRCARVWRSSPCSRTSTSRSRNRASTRGQAAHAQRRAAANGARDGQAPPRPLASAGRRAGTDSSRTAASRPSMRTTRPCPPLAPPSSSRPHRRPNKSGIRAHRDTRSGCRPWRSLGARWSRRRSWSPRRAAFRSERPVPTTARSGRVAELLEGGI